MDYRLTDALPDETTWDEDDEPIDQDDEHDFDETDLALGEEE